MKDALIDLFFPRRLGRLNYFLRGVPLGGFLGYLVYDLENRHGPELVSALATTLLLLGYFLWFVTLPRVRDCGMSAWTLLLVFIPVVGQLFGLILAWRHSWTPLDAAFREGHREPSENDAPPASGLTTEDTEVHED